MSNVVFTADEALGEYRRLTVELGRFPTVLEFETQARMSLCTLYKKVGRIPVVRERMRGTAEDPWETRWLAEEWERARKVVAHCSSMLRERKEPWDVAWVVEDDWPGAPGKVLSHQESDEVRRQRVAACNKRLSKPGRATRLGRASREEILEAMRAYAERCRDFPMAEFLSATGITCRDIYLEFPSWAELRRAAGFRTARSPRRKIIPDSALLDGWVAAKQKAGRNPTTADIARHTRFGRHTYFTRFGRKEDVVRRAEHHERWLEYEAERARELAKDPEGPWGRGLFQTISTGPPRETLGEQFAKLSVGYALTSRMTKEWVEKPQILVCVQHDWPGYPHWVVEVMELRGGRATG
jgi:hypothetical protein